MSTSFQILLLALALVTALIIILPVVRTNGVLRWRREMLVPVLFAGLACIGAVEF